MTNINVQSLTLSPINRSEQTAFKANGIFTQVLTLMSLVLLFILAIIASSQNALAEESNHHPSPAEEITYIAHDNDMERVDHALKRAIKDNKRLLLILGAQWCHDSIGFAAKLKSAELHNVMEQRYETLFIDIGHYTDKRHITQRFGYPTVFGTPTVLIIDPASETLLNLDTLTRFNNADAMPVTDYVTYFTDFTAKTYSNSDLNVAAEEWMTFEQTQTQRLMHGYEALAPFMQANDAGELKDKKPFHTLWGQVRDFRFQLQKDIHALRTGQLKSFPSYAIQAWE